LGYLKEDLKLLIELGFAKNQAILYLTLLTNGRTDARTLSVLTSLHRTEVYRSLGELEKKGLVDKEVGAPLRFVAVSPSLGLQNALEMKINEVEKTGKKTAEFIKNFSPKEDSEDSSQYPIKIIDGRKRILQQIKQQHDVAKETIEIISILPRWLQIMEECLDNYVNALKRGVRYRIIVGSWDSKNILPQTINRLLEMPNFKLKTIILPQTINSAIFDSKEVTFNYYPLKSLGHSPLIVTNHPSFIDLSKGYFEAVWSSLPNNESTETPLLA
jgi:sugar-specific transcriptional regulator TrmB